MKTLNFFSPGFDVKFGYQTRNGEIQNKFKLTLRLCGGLCLRRWMITNLNSFTSLHNAEAHK